MLGNSNGPSVVALCLHCELETVWLRTINGGWLLFDASTQLTETTFEGNRFAVDSRTRLVRDLDCVLESRWPTRCLTLHKYRCPDSYDESRFYRRRPRQANDIDLSDLWRRLAAAENDQGVDDNWRLA
ncbi:hypothetical protein JYB55_22095 [Mycolicibacterium septicum]|nr:hypothetical protein [Mycolicibacterium septicum]